MGALKKHHFGPSRADSDWRAAKALKNFAGFVFVCNKSTIPDLDRGIFGLPGSYEDSVRNIHRGMPLFLFDCTSRRLYGVFEAASGGGYNIDPFAWENDDGSRRRHANAVSKYPAQVRVSIRAEKPALEEESFRSILDYMESSKFRLELSALQVQQLLCLFDAAQAAGRECIVERNRGKQNLWKVKYREHRSPRSTSKSDSDSCSDCSSRGLNSCEDEWADEIACENLHYHGDHERMVSERLSQVSLDACPHYDKHHLKLQVEAPDKARLGYYEDEGRVSKRSFRETHPGSGSDSENTMLSRLHETDPAVNSNLNHYIQRGVDQSIGLSGQDALVTMSTHQMPFACSDNVIFIPVQAVLPQPRESVRHTNQSQRVRWNEHKKYSKGALNFKKQGFNPERCHTSRDTGHEPQQQSLPDCVAVQKHQRLVPLCSRQPGQTLKDPIQLASLSPLVVPSSADNSRTGSQLQTEVVVDEAGHGFGAANDLQVPSPESPDLHKNHNNLPIMLVPRPPAGCSQPTPTAFVETLHFEILQFARWTRPSRSIQLHVEAAIDCVRKGVKSVWPEADVEVFGSFATGLCLQHSDVDLAVIDAPQISSTESLSIAQASACLVRELAETLKSYEWCESIKPLDTASMPVLKCLCRPFGSSADTSTKASTVAVDITIGGMRNSYFSWNPAAQVLDAADHVPVPGKVMSRHTGGAAREYVLHKIEELPALAPLVLLLKSFLHHKNLSNVYSGGLGSFSLTLLVAFYLERIMATRGFSPDRGVIGSSAPYTSSSISCSVDLSKDSDPSSSSCNLQNDSSGIDYNGHSLGERYVRRAADAVERVVSFWDQDGSLHLGVFLLGFLQTFGFVLDLSREKIVLKGIDGSPGGFFKRDDRHVALWIDDPLRPGVNIGAGSFGMVHVQAAFKELFQSVTERPVFLSSLQCDDKDCQDLLAFSHLVHIGRIVVAADDC
ncbi:hypothetical protein L7F22_010577 [Adiantum nelumboides]|nr:hypothetical protein [Adiantum nelumboides]